MHVYSYRKLLVCIIKTLVMVTVRANFGFLENKADGFVKLEKMYKSNLIA